MRRSVPFLLLLVVIVSGCGAPASGPAQVSNLSTPPPAVLPTATLALKAALFVREPFFDFKEYNVTLALADAEGHAVAVAGQLHERWVDDRGTVVLDRTRNVATAEFVPKPNGDVLLVGDISIRGPVLTWTLDPAHAGHVAANATNLTVEASFTSATRVLRASYLVHEVSPLVDPKPVSIAAYGMDLFGNYSAQVWLKGASGKPVAADALLDIRWSDAKGKLLYREQRVVNASAFGARSGDDPSLSYVWTASTFNTTTADGDLDLAISGLTPDGHELAPVHASVRLDDASRTPAVVKWALKIGELRCENATTGGCQAWNVTLAVTNQGNYAGRVQDTDFTAYDAGGTEYPIVGKPQQSIRVEPGKVAEMAVVFSDPFGTFVVDHVVFHPFFTDEATAKPS